MNVKRRIGIIVLVIGIAFLLLSNYITTQVQEGKLKIAKGQKTVDQSQRLFSLSPTTKEVGKGVTRSAQKKIDEGKRQVRDYEAIAARLQVFGIIGVVVGGGLIVYSFMGTSNKKKKRK